jgi:hypothetical protein
MTPVFEARIGIWFYQLAPGISYLQTTPTVLRHAKRFGDTLAAKDPQFKFKLVSIDLGSEHPVYDLLRPTLPRVIKPYAWYIRIPNPIGFLQLLAPVLERRVAASAIAGHTGELKINGYTWGAKMVFTRGGLTEIVPWQATPDDIGHARFPNLTFLMLLMGRRTFDEIAHLYPDCSAEENVPAVLDILFPKRYSLVWGVA